MSSDRALLTAIAAGRPDRGPHTLHLDITNGCNTNCITCWDHSPLLFRVRPAEWKRQRVEAPAIETLLDDALTLGGLEAVIVSGMGEPFTHPDVYRILAAVKQRGLHLTVTTNLIPADADRVLALGVDQLLIGVHAASESAYRAFHPSFQHDEWQRLLSMLVRFRDAGRRYKQVQVISRVNAHELVAMVRFGHRLGAHSVSYKLASLGHGTERSAITEEQRVLLREVLVPEAVEVARELSVATNLDVFARQLEAGGAATAPVREIGCFMGYVYSRVLVDGTVLYCCSTEVRVGSLADGTRFSDLWRGPAWAALRARLRRGEYFASCSQCGKLEQNVRIGERLTAVHGRAGFVEATGQSDGAASTASELVTLRAASRS